MKIVGSTFPNLSQFVVTHEGQMVVVAGVKQIRTTLRISWISNYQLGVPPTISIAYAMNSAVFPLSLGKIRTISSRN